LADVELYCVTLPKVLEPLSIHRTLVEEIFLPCVVLDEPKSLINSQCSNRSRHCRLLFVDSRAHPLHRERFAWPVNHRWAATRASSIFYPGGDALSPESGRHVEPSRARMHLAMCVEWRLVGTCSPRNLQRTLPAETWTCCIQRKHTWAVCSTSRVSGTSLAVGQAMRSKSTFPAGRFGLAVRCANLHASE
jgi:hypothetical protein